MTFDGEKTHKIQITSYATNEIVSMETSSQELVDLKFWIATTQIARTSIGSVKLLHQILDLVEKMEAKS